MPNYDTLLNGSNNNHQSHYYHSQYRKKHKLNSEQILTSDGDSIGETYSDFYLKYYDNFDAAMDDDEGHNEIIKNDKNNNEIRLVNEDYGVKSRDESLLRVLICTESFHPYTSGIARRFKEIIRRLSKRNFLIHIVTGCKVVLENTLYQSNRC